MNGVWHRCIIMLLFVTTAACTEQQDSASGAEPLPSAGEVRSKWKLPSRLREISGLALTPDGRLFAVDDEQAIIYQVDDSDGRLLKAFALGKPVLRGDFEGLAYLDDSLFLMNSRGVLFRLREGDDGDRVAYQKIDTGLSKQCEFEGLAQDPENGRLLLVCKNVRKKADIDVLSIFVWRPGDRHIDIDERIELPVDAILKSIEKKNLNPSGIAVDPMTGSILVVAASQHTVIELDQKGSFVSAILLTPEKWHRQAEGIEISTSGELIIADEGGSDRARLTVYKATGVDINTNNE